MTDSEKLDLLLEKMGNLETRINQLDKKVDKLEVGQIGIKKELYMIDRQITDTYKLALDAWGQGVENRTWLENGTLKP